MVVNKSVLLSIKHANIKHARNITNRRLCNKTLYKLQSWSYYDISVAKNATSAFLFASINALTQ